MTQQVAAIEVYKVVLGMTQDNLDDWTEVLHTAQQRRFHLVGDRRPAAVREKWALDRLVWALQELLPPELGGREFTEGEDEAQIEGAPHGEADEG